MEPSLSKRYNLNIPSKEFYGRFKLEPYLVNRLITWELLSCSLAELKAKVLSPVFNDSPTLKLLKYKSDIYPIHWHNDALVVYYTNSAKVPVERQPRFIISIRTGMVDGVIQKAAIVQHDRRNS